MKLHLACGTSILDGWHNVDLTRQHMLTLVHDLTELPLIWNDGEAEFILCSHFIEHLDSRQAYHFLEELYRIVAVGGIVRICVPSIERLYRLQQSGGCIGNDNLSELMTQHREFYKQNWGNLPIKSLSVDHGHKTVWSSDLLTAVMTEIGFHCQPALPNHSSTPELRGIDGHDKVIGPANNFLETIVIEGTKL